MLFLLQVAPVSPIIIMYITIFFKLRWQKRHYVALVKEQQSVYIKVDRYLSRAGGWPHIDEKLLVSDKPMASLSSYNLELAALDGNLAISCLMSVFS